MIVFGIIVTINLIVFIGIAVKEKDNKEECGKVYISKGFKLIGYIAGIVGTNFFGIAFVLQFFLYNETSSWWVALGFALFVLLGISIILECRNWRIDIGDDTFQYHTLFGRVFTFHYSEIIKTRRTNSTIHIYTARKHLYIDTTMACNIDEFMAAVSRDQINRRYEKQGMTLPKQKHKKKHI